MKKLFFAFMALTAWAVQTRAADGITIANANVPKGGEAVVEVLLTSADMSYGGFQFEVMLPTGISLENVEKAARLTAIENYVLQKRLTDEENNTYTVLGYNTDRQSIEGTSGAVVYLTLKANADMTVGDVFNATVQNVVLSTIDEENIDAPSSSFTITIEENDGRIILDETAEEAPEASDGEVNVRVLRTIKANEWSTICLPFAMSADQIQSAFGDDVTVELADAVSYETTEDDDDNIVSITINFNNVSPLAIEANHPYIIKVDKKITSFDVDGVDVNPATSVSGRRKKIGTGSYFIGNYENQTEVPEFSLFLNGNKFWYSTGATKMKAFRAYFTLRDVLTEVDEAAARIGFCFDEATGIRDNNRETITNNRYYDLQGRSVGTPARKGLYINNGKKVVVK